MLELAVIWTLFSTQFERAHLLFGVNPVAVSQRLQAARHRALILGMESIGVEITEGTLVRHQGAARLGRRLVVCLSSWSAAMFLACGKKRRLLLL